MPRGVQKILGKLKQGVFCCKTAKVFYYNFLELFTGGDYQA